MRSASFPCMSSVQRTGWSAASVFCSDCFLHTECSIVDVPDLIACMGEWHLSTIYNEVFWSSSSAVHRFLCPFYHAIQHHYFSSSSPFRNFGSSAVMFLEWHFFMHAHRTFSTARLLTASASRCAHLPAGPLSTLGHCKNPSSALPYFLQHAVLDSASSFWDHNCFFTISSNANPCTPHSLL